jgi:hypothetical protein
MKAQTKDPLHTEFYGRCFITSQPKCVCNVWVPYAFVAWREYANGVSTGVQVHRFPELDHLLFLTEAEAISVGFSTAQRWADTL